MGRPPVTFNGDPAVMPKPLREPARTGVSFLLEEDRARVLKVRCPVVDLGAALRRHLTAGGPEVNAFRLDYLTAWADPAKTVDHRALSDAIEESEHTPGARLSNKMSDKIHVALVGQGKRHDHTKAADPKLYADLVTADLRYKEEILQQALDALDATNDSNLRAAYRAIEGDSQTIWRRRRELHASDLVRFGRTYRWWRNNQVTAVESDANCEKQLLALTNEHGAAGDCICWDTQSGVRECCWRRPHRHRPRITRYRRGGSDRPRTRTPARQLRSRRSRPGSRRGASESKDSASARLVAVLLLKRSSASLRLGTASRA